jgi:hypothetical protein
MISGSESIYNETVAVNTPGPNGLNLIYTCYCCPEETVPSGGCISKTLSFLSGVISIFHCTSFLSGFESIISCIVG